MEKAIAKHLGEKDRHAIARELGHVHAGLLEPLDLADGHTGHTLHHDHFRMAIVPQHFRNEHQVQAGHVAAQLGRVRRLAHQVQFVVQVLVEFAHHLAGLEPLRIGRQALDPAGHHRHQRQVFLDHRQHVRAQHLHRHIACMAIRTRHGRKMNLGDGGAGERFALEMREHGVHRPAKGPLDGGNGDRRRKRRDPVLQMRQFIGDVRRQQVAPGRKHLAELDEDRPQPFQRLAQPTAARRVELAAY